MVAMVAGMVMTAASAPAAVTVAVLPASQTVAPGAEFDLTIEVTQSGSAFNAFDAYIGYDPAALTLVSHLEGPYFTAACGSRYYTVKSGADRDTITDVLLCANTSVTGPGVIYRYHFRASNTPQVTTVRFLPGLQFYNAGLFVNPAISSDATIGIGTSAGVEPGPRVDRVRLSAAPNPARGATAFTITAPHSGMQCLTVTDLQGRLVRTLAKGEFPAGTHSVSWDGRDESGARVAPGVYLGALRIPGQTLNARITRLN